MEGTSITSDAADIQKPLPGRKTGGGHSSVKKMITG
jgi:hypothetical protein